MSRSRPSRAANNSPLCRATLEGQERGTTTQEKKEEETLGAVGPEQGDHSSH